MTCCVGFSGGQGETEKGQEQNTNKTKKKQTKNWKAECEWALEGEKDASDILVPVRTGLQTYVECESHCVLFPFLLGFISPHLWNATSWQDQKEWFLSPSVATGPSISGHQRRLQHNTAVGSKGSEEHEALIPVETHMSLSRLRGPSCSGPITSLAILSGHANLTFGPRFYLRVREHYDWETLQKSCGPDPSRTEQKWMERVESKGGVTTELGFASHLECVMTPFLSPCGKASSPNSRCRLSCSGNTSCWAGTHHRPL